MTRPMGQPVAGIYGEEDRRARNTNLNRRNKKDKQMDEMIKPPEPKKSKLAIYSLIICIIGLVFILPLKKHLFYIGLYSLILSFLLGIIGLIVIWRSNGKLSGVKYILLSFTIFLIANILIPQDIFPTGNSLIRSKVSRVAAEEQSLYTVLESYFIDYNCYPKPEYDEEGNPVIPHVLTTPLAYMTNLFHDPFKKHGKGVYGYGCDSIGGWIVTSYGPDVVSGNYGIMGGAKMSYLSTWADKELGFTLKDSGLTFDPSNGVISPGDVWNRGP